MKLTIELVPKTSWCSNLRSELPKSQWDSLRRSSYKRAGYVCEICGGKGHNHPVECHEIWEYDDKNKIQKLIGLISLCPSCHEAKHIGLAQIRGRGGIVRKHLVKINNCSLREVDNYIEEVFSLWRERSKYQWTLDLSLLEELKRGTCL